MAEDSSWTLFSRNMSIFQTGVIINGGVNIGDCSFIGSGCIIKEGVRIGKRVVISAGKTVMEDIPSDVILK